MSKANAHIRITGHVQGVGFRHFATRRAQQYDLNGWVKNKGDGSVEIEVEGDKSRIEEFIGEVKSGPSAASVDDVAVDWRDHTGQYTNFDVTY